MRRRRRAIEHGRIDGGEIAELLCGARLQIGRYREQIVEARRIHEGHLGPALRRLAHAMRQHRRFAAQVRSHHEQRVQLVDARDAEPAEARRRRIRGLVAEVRLAQAVIDVVRPQRARQARE